mgnify:CR=1 FL=1
MTGGEQDEVENRQCQKRVRRKPGRSKDTAANPLRNTLQRDIEDLLRAAAAAAGVGGLEA